MSCNRFSDLLIFVGSEKYNTQHPRESEQMKDLSGDRYDVKKYYAVYDVTLSSLFVTLFSACDIIFCLWCHFVFSVCDVILCL